MTDEEYIEINKIEVDNKFNFMPVIGSIIIAIIIILVLVLYVSPIQAKNLKEGRDWYPVEQIEANNFMELTEGDKIWSYNRNLYVYEITYKGKYYNYISPIYDNDTILPKLRELVKKDHKDDTIRIRSSIIYSGGGNVFNKGSISITRVPCILKES